MNISGAYQRDAWPVKDDEECVNISMEEYRDLSAEWGSYCHKRTEKSIRRMQLEACILLFLWSISAFICYFVFFKM